MPILLFLQAPPDTRSRSAFDPRRGLNEACPSNSASIWIAPTGSMPRREDVWDRTVTETCCSVPALHGTAGTVRGWLRPMVKTQITPTVAVAAIGIMASGKLPVSDWIQPIR